MLVEPTEGGRDIRIGTMTGEKFGTVDPFIQDIAVGSDGRLWGVGAGLFSIDPTNAKVQTYVGLVDGTRPLDGIRALTADTRPNSSTRSLLFGVSGYRSLVMVDPRYGQVRRIGQLWFSSEGAVLAMGDLAFGPDGELYGSALRGSGWGIVRVNTQTAEVTPVRMLGDYFYSVPGITFVGDTLYALVADKRNEESILLRFDPGKNWLPTTVRKMSFIPLGSS
jgi:hypothetical protein